MRTPRLHPTLLAEKEKKKKEKDDEEISAITIIHCVPIVIQLPHDPHCLSPSFGEGNYDLIKSILSTLRGESNNVSGPRYRAYQRRVCFPCSPIVIDHEEAIFLLGT